MEVTEKSIRSSKIHLRNIIEEKVNVFYSFTSIKSRLIIKLFFMSLYRSFQELMRNTDVHRTHLTKKRENEEKR